MERSLAMRLVTTFGLGHLRPASGTWGSMPPAVLAAAMVMNGWCGTWMWHVALIAIVVLFTLACVRAGDLAEAIYGKKDPSQVVADETAGMALTLLAVPWWATGDEARLVMYVLGAFVMFRLTDIVKAWPAGGLQRVPGGWGIVLDDLIAGVQAGIVVAVVGWFVR